jgi:hypothetical protein
LSTVTSKPCKDSIRGLLQIGSLVQLTCKPSSDAVEACNAATSRFRNVKQTWRLLLFVLPGIVQAGVGEAPGREERASAYEIRDLKVGKGVIKMSCGSSGSNVSTLASVSGG